MVLGNTALDRYFEPHPVVDDVQYLMRRQVEVLLQPVPDRRTSWPVRRLGGGVQARGVPERRV